MVWVVEDAVYVTASGDSERRHLNTPFKDTPSMPKHLLISPLSEILPFFNRQKWFKGTMCLWETFSIQNTEVSVSFGILQLNILER